MLVILLIKKFLCLTEEKNGLDGKFWNLSITVTIKNLWEKRKLFSYTALQSAEVQELQA